MKKTFGAVVTSAHFANGLSPSAKRNQVLRQAVLEQLEDRTLLSYTFSYDPINQTATATGDSSVNALTIEPVSGFLEYSVNGSAFSGNWSGNTVPASATVRLDINVSTGSGSSLTLGTPTGPASDIEAAIDVVAPEGNTDTVVIDDSTDSAQNTYNIDTVPGTVTATGLNYNESASYVFGGGITLKGGAVDGDIYNVTSVVKGLADGMPEPFTILTGASGNSTVNVGSGGTVSNIQAALAVSAASGGSATINVNDSADVSASTATLDDNSPNISFPYEVTGLTTAPIEWGAGVAAVNVNGGAGPGGAGVSYAVKDTQSGTTTTINGGGDITLGGNASAPLGMQGLNGTIDIGAGSGETLTLDDSQDTSGQTPSLSNDGTNGQILGLAPAIINYIDADASSLTVDGGSGGNTFTINNTAADFTTNLNSGTGADTVNVLAAGNGDLNIFGQNGLDTVTLGGAASPIGMQNLAGTINVDNGGDYSSLILDDSEDTTGRAVSMSDDGTNGTITGISPATITYPDSEISGLTVQGGSGGNTFTVNGTPANGGYPGTLTTLDKGSGSNTVNVNAITGGSILDLTGTGSPDTVNLGSGGSLANIQGQLEINEAADSTSLVVDLSGDDLPHDLTLSGDGTTSTLADADGNMAPVSFNTSSVASFTLDTSPFQDESLTVDFSGGNPLPAAFIFDGGANAASPPDSHSITLTGTPPSGPFITETEVAGALPTGSISFTDSGGNDTAIDYSGIQPIVDTTPALTYTFDDTAADQSFTATNGPTVGGFATIQFTNTPSNPSTATFETTTLANKAAIIFNAPNQGDTGLTGAIDIPTASTGLTTLGFNIYANSENEIAVAALPAGVATSLYSGPAGDITSVTGAGVPAGSTLVTTGGAGVDTLDFDADGLTPTVTAGAAAGEVLITIPGYGTVDATGYENINLTNVAPVAITVTNSAVHAVEGAPATTTVGTFTFPLAAIGITNPAGLPASDFTALINWGDGSSSAGTITQDTSNPGLYYITGSHTYAAHGSYTISNTVAFTGDTYSSTLNGANVSVTVAAAGPTTGTSASATVAAAPLSAQGATVTGTEGISLGSVLLATFMDTGTIASPSGYTAIVNWGDGTTSAAIITSTGTPNGTLFSVFGNHLYTNVGSYPITVTITKPASGATAIASSEAIIADAILSAGTPVVLTPHTGATITSSVGTFTDADPVAPTSDFTAIIYWGDGSNSAGTISQPGGVGTAFVVTGTHAYATPGSYSITTNVADVGGSKVTLSATATVTDVTVTGTVRTFPAVEGQNTGTIVLATFTDPNPLATAADLTATLPLGGWGDGTPAVATDLTITQIGGTATSSLFEITGSHTYAAAGTFPVNITVTTSGGATTALTAGAATVAAAVFSPSLGTPIVATEGAASKSYVVGIFTDANPGATAADFTGTVTATSSSGAAFTGTDVTFTALGGGAFSVSAGLTFPTAGVWSISTAVTDTSGNKALLITTANVAYAALIPGTTPNITSTVKLSTGLVVVGTFTDANPNPTASEFSSVIDWGDGSPTSLGTISITPGVNGGPSTINILGTHTYETYGQYTITVVTSEGGGGQTVTTTSTANANQPHLVFVNGPATTLAGNKLPVIKVYAEDAFGNLAFQDHSKIKLEIYTGTPAEGQLIGQVNAKIKDGIAQFGRISLKIAGDYTLVAVDGRYAQAVSSLFSITPAAAKKLAFTSLPASAAAAHPFGVQVEVWDKYGNLETSNSSTVTLKLGKHPGGAALSGVTSAAAVGGIADFDDLVVSAAGNYELVAADSATLPKRVSDRITVG